MPLISNFIHTYTHTHTHVQHIHTRTQSILDLLLINRRKLFCTHLEVRILILKIKII